MKRNSLYDSLILHLSLIVLATLLVYANSLDGPFIFDDTKNIVENTLMRDLEYFIHPSSAEGHFMAGSLKQRWVGYLSFYLNYRIHGLNVTGYHIVNLGIHAVTVMLVYIFVLLSLMTPLLRGAALEQKRKVIALLSALVFAVHPVETQAVTYIVQRFASLAAMFSVAAVVCYVGGRMAGPPLRRRILFSGAVVFYILALKTKQNTVPLAMVIAAYEFMFFREGLKKSLVWILPFMALMMVLPLGMLAGGGPDTGDGGIGGQVLKELSVQPIPRITYLITQLRVMATYFRLLLFPMNQTLDYAYPLSASLSDPGALGGAVLVISLVTFAVLMYWRSLKGYPVLALGAFGIFWFFMLLSVESTLVPLFPIYEHRLYLPSIGMIMAFTAMGTQMYEMSGTQQLRKALFTAAIMVPLLFGAATHARNAVWQDEVRFWSDVVDKAPGNPRAITTLGQALTVREGTTPRVIDIFQQAVLLAPDYPLGNYNLGTACLVVGRVDDAVRYLSHAVKISPQYADAHENLGLAYYSRKESGLAERHLRLALKHEPSSPTVHNNLGVVLRDQGKWADAVEHFRQAVRFSPNYDTAWTNLGEALMRLGKHEDANLSLQRALAVNPRNAKARALLK